MPLSEPYEIRALCLLAVMAKGVEQNGKGYTQYELLKKCTDYWRYCNGLEIHPYCCPYPPQLYKLLGMLKDRGWYAPLNGQTWRCYVPTDTGKLKASKLGGNAHKWLWVTD